MLESILKDCLRVVMRTQGGEIEEFDGCMAENMPENELW